MNIFVHPFKIPLAVPFYFSYVRNTISIGDKEENTLILNIFFNTIIKSHCP